MLEDEAKKTRLASTVPRHDDSRSTAEGEYTDHAEVHCYRRRKGQVEHRSVSKAVQGGCPDVDLHLLNLTRKVLVLCTE